MMSAKVNKKIMLIIENLRITRPTQRRLEGEMQHAERLNNVRLYKIVWALLLLHRNQTASEVAQRWRVSSRRIYDWATRFITEQFSWLANFHFAGRGRKPKLTRKQRTGLYDIVVQGPQVAGFDCGAWNSAMLAQIIQQPFNRTYNPRYLCALLKDLGLSYPEGGLHHRSHGGRSFISQAQPALNFGPSRLPPFHYNAPILAIGAIADGYRLGFWSPRSSQNCPTALGTASI